MTMLRLSEIGNKALFFFGLANLEFLLQLWLPDKLAVSNCPRSGVLKPGVSHELTAEC